METLAKSDIFFFITSVAVVLFTLIGLIVLFYVIRFARMAFLISKKIKAESDNISNDIAMIRAKVHEEGLGIRTMYRLFTGFFGNTLGKKRHEKGSKGEKTSKASSSRSARSAKAEDEEGIN